MKIGKKIMEVAVDIIIIGAAIEVIDKVRGNETAKQIVEKCSKLVTKTKTAVESKAEEVKENITE